MSRPFRLSGDAISLRLDPREVAVLATIPMLLDTGDDAEGRLSYVAHPDDDDADARYQSLVAGSLDDLRSADRTRFERVVAGDPVPAEDVEGFMRVVGEARLVLAARLGIEDDGWEASSDATTDPEIALLGWLGYLQDAAVGVLMRLL